VRASELRVVGQSHAIELKNRIDLPGLNAGLFEERLCSHLGEQHFRYAPGPLVAIVNRISNEPARCIQQRKVNAPGIDAHRNRALSIAGLEPGKSCLHLCPDVQHIPKEAVANADTAVGESVQFL